MKLIINADDFGYTKANTEGIIEGCRKGIIRSTTALCNMPYLEWGKELAENCPQLGIGVHLTLTLGKALTGVHSFTDSEGNFLDKKAIYAARLDMDEVYAEWKAQIERYIQVFGHLPTHLDSHHSVHDFNEKQKAVALRLADEYGLYVRRYSPYAYVAGFYGPTATRETLIGLLQDNRDRDIEIMTHPGFCDLELYRASSYSTGRVQELDVLCSQEVLDYVNENGVELVHYERREDL